MSRWKRISSERLIAATLVLFTTSIGGIAGCEIFSEVDRSQIPTNAGGGGTGATGGGDVSSTGSMSGGMGGAGGAMCTPVDDNNDCTIDECVNGAPVNTPITEGSPCSANGGAICDGNGACVQCVVAADCTGMDTACQTRTCTMGMCGFDYTAANTPIPTQNMGDCQVTVCDGNGGQKQNNDDLDLPDDMNACTDDVCAAGMPSHPQKAAGTNCGMNGMGDPLVCNAAGQCVGCIAPSDCTGTDTECSTRTCVNSICGVSFTAANTPVAAQMDNNCLLHVCDGAGQFKDIADDLDLPPDDGNACTDETCAGGMPNHPDRANGTPCVDTDLCTTMDTCQSGICTSGTPTTCAALDQCHIAGTCDPMTGMCSNPNATDGTNCNDNNACTQSDACSGGTCTGTNPVTCTASDQCHIAGTCDPMTGMCSNPNATDGTNCNDNNPCTQTDACSAGTCTGMNPVTCAASDQCHIAGTCNQQTGMCSNPNAMDGTMCISGTATGACTMGTCIACGDGILAGGEVCDDGNATAGDGCSATCGIEMGWACMGTPSVCTAICGDGRVVGTEMCDDSNTASGDGCSNSCQIDISCGSGEIPVLLTQTPAAAIPDNAQGGIANLANIAQTGVVRKVISSFNITHPNTSHVDAWLISPYGVERDLATDATSGANFIGTTFSDAATTAITAGTAPYTGTYKPENTISDAAGHANQSADGQWSLRIADDTPTTTGTLNSWTIALCVDPTVTSVCGNGYVEPNEQCDDGNAVSGDGCNACQLEITCAANETLVFQKSTDLPRIIPAGDAAGISSNISLSNPGIVGKAVVVVNSISHTYDTDLSLSLTSPTGTTLDLSSANGGTNDNFVSTIFTDAATTNVTAGVAPFRGAYKPEQALSGLILQPVAGTWTFKAVDADPLDAGQFNSWSLGLCVAPVPVCGNGSIELGEACDDMNNTANDGCSSACAIEPGWRCSGMPSVCTMLSCGDGVVSGTEECDDGNPMSGDGCSSMCQLEPGYTCTTAMPNVCTFTCGNGNVSGSELCDDGNTMSGDGCSSVCEPEITCNAGEVPVVISNRTLSALPDGPQGGIASLINVSQVGVVRKVIPTLNVLHPNTGDVDAWLISPYAVERELATDVGTSANFLGTAFSDAAATSITAGTAPYTGTFRPEQTISDAIGFGNSSANGPWSLRIADDTSGTAGNLKAWTLALCVDPNVTNVCGNGFVEPNEQCDDGNMASGDGCSSCQIEFTCGANQTLVFQKSTTAPQIIPAAVAAGITSTIAISNTGLVAKAAVVVNSISHTWDNDLSLSLISPGGTTLDLSSGNGSSGDNYASTFLADAATTLVTAGAAPFRGYFKPEQALSGLITQPANGTWTFKVVDASTGDAGHLNSWSLALCVAASPVCGNGIVDLTEACDDTNTTAGDGCSSTCTIEPGWRCTGSPSVCTLLVCGDGILSNSELCDDGNLMNGDGCSSTCDPEITCNAGEVPVVVSNRPGSAIPDGAQGGIASLLNVTQTGLVRKVVPTINVAHANTGDIDTWLIAPYGVQRELATDVGTSANFLGTSFSDTAATSITAGTAPYTGTFRPEQTISDAAGFGNQAANGQWSLRIADDTATTTGTLNSWAVALCIDPTILNVCGNGYVEPNEQCDDTNMVSGDGCSNCQLEFTCGANQTLVVQKSTDAPQIIPDSTPAGIQSTMAISNAGVVAKAAVVLNSISHTYDSDMSVSLISPTGTTLDLTSGNGSSGDNYVGTIIADAATSAITAGTAPFRGYFRPEQALSGLIAQTTTGNWTLKIVDGANGDAGQLNSWSLALCVAPTPVCGNGVLDIGEACDDTNTAMGDGCSATCTIESGYICSGTPSVCVLSCGDGVINGADQCDDMNTTANDGCSATCTVEQGYTCTGIPSACLFTCGNGVVTGNEQCDDGNTTANDSCNNTCQWEKVAEVEPNGTIGEADTNATNNPQLLINGTRNVTGGLTASDKDIFKVVVSAADTVVSFETFDASGRDCVGINSTRLTLLNSMGTQLKQDAITAGISNCAELAVLLQPGTYYIQVDNSSGTAVPNYFLRTLFHNNNGSESEPNDMQMTANTDNGYSTQIYGAHQVTTDTDWYSLTIPQGGSLRIETIEGDATETCELLGIDSTIALFDSAGMQLVSDLDTGRGYCSQIDGTGASPVNANASNRAAGTYYIRVTSDTTANTAANQFNYRLVVVVR